MKKPLIDLGIFGGCTHREIDPQNPFKPGAKLQGIKPMFKTVKAQTK